MGMMSLSLVKYQIRFRTFIGVILLIGTCIDLTIVVSMMLYLLTKNHQKAVTRVTLPVASCTPIRKLLVENSFEVNSLDSDGTHQGPG